MSFEVDNKLEHENCFFINTVSGNKYCVKLDETSPSSKKYILSFLLLKGNPDYKEVFKTLYTMKDILKNHLINKKIDSVFAYIDGKNRKERDKKTRIFFKLVEYPFECLVDSLPEIRIQGHNEIYYPDTNIIHIRRIPNSEITDKKEPKVEQTSQNQELKVKIKFCYECGSENRGYKFCPNCGTNLQQA